MAERVCLACGSSIEGTHPRRKYCDDRCKRRYHRGARAEEDDQEQVTQPSSDGIQSTEAATMLALAEAGKLGTPGGQAALVLARRIDRSHMDTGGGLASMVKRLQETMESLIAEGAEDGDDLVDELARRREEKQARAAAV